MDRREWLRRSAAAWVLARTPASAAMIERAIPKTGEKLPAIGLGTWQTFDVGPAAYTPLASVLRRFAELGGKLIDSSPMYGRSETVTGDLAAQLKLHDRLFFATKVWTRGASAGVQQMNDSFRKMRVRKMDLMQVHNLLDADAHLKTLAQWKAQGRIRYTGVTHYTVSSYPALERFLPRGDIDFVQFNYSLATRAAEQRLLPMAAEHKVATLINRPFESGEMFPRVRGRPLPSWAKEIGCETWAQIFLKYVISHPAVTCAIPATSDVRHLEDNMGAGVGVLPDGALRKRMAEDWEQLR